MYVIYFSNYRLSMGEHGRQHNTLWESQKSPSMRSKKALIKIKNPHKENKGLPHTEKKALHMKTFFPADASTHTTEQFNPFL